MLEIFGTEMDGLSILQLGLIDLLRLGQYSCEYFGEHGLVDQLTGSNSNCLVSY